MVINYCNLDSSKSGLICQHKVLELNYINKGINKPKFYCTDAALAQSCTYCQQKTYTLVIKESKND